MRVRELRSDLKYKQGRSRSLGTIEHCRQWVSLGTKFARIALLCWPVEVRRAKMTKAISFPNWSKELIWTRKIITRDQPLRCWPKIELNLFTYKTTLLAMNYLTDSSFLVAERNEMKVNKSARIVSRVIIWENETKKATDWSIMTLPQQVMGSCRTIVTKSVATLRSLAKIPCLQTMDQMCPKLLPQIKVINKSRQLILTHI